VTKPLALCLAASLTACSVDSGGPEPDEDGAGGKSDDADAAASPVCQHTATFPSSVLADALRDKPGAIDPSGTPIISNYTAWPSYDPTSKSARMDPNVTRRIDDPDEALANIATTFGDCNDAVAEHIRTAKPNVYIYFTGFGAADQNNSVIGEGSVLRWINERDPNALIFSINWNCAASNDPFCGRNTKAIAATDASPHVKSMNRAIDTIVPQIASKEVATQLKASIAGFGQQQQGYDSAHSHSMQLAAQLIDQLLVADAGKDGESRIGDIRIAGYSMGAHSAAQLLVQDFSTDGSGGFQWSRKACRDGGDRCTVAELDKVKWSLAMGLSGWSDALRGENRFDADGLPGVDPEERAQLENGGLFRVGASKYAGKLAVLNRRMDPTSNSDDTFQRGFLDIFFGDYNHYSHDYALPLFIDDGFVRALDAFLESGAAKGSREMGIVYDNAGRVDFDACPVDGTCEAGTGYVAHEANRSHAVLDVPTVNVRTVDGVDHPEKAVDRAASLREGDQPIALRTFDQEDLRGGVELYLRPHYDPSAAGLHGVFSYGTCEGSDEELMPSAFVEDGKLVFEMTWQGERFAATVDAAQAGLAKDAWTHLAFTWELPVESLSVPHESAADLAAALPRMAPDLQKHKVALVLATGLQKPLATTYKRQKGVGSMRIFVNGEPVVEAELGTADSSRECLAARDVLTTERFDVNGVEFPAFVPYARYDGQSGDVVAFSPDQVLGTKCKAYRVRNEEAFFGCAQSEAVNADADMDDITLVWGPGRTDYEDIDHDTGEPVTWPIGVAYDDTPLKL
jgi:hypothetical protein